MTKDDAIKAVIPIVAGFTGTVTPADGETSFVAGDGATEVLRVVDWTKPMRITMSLDSYSEFCFRFDGKEVVLTPAEIFEALNKKDEK